MLVHEFDNLMETTPFRPFRMFMAGGKSVFVSGPEYAWHPPASRTVVVAAAEGRERRMHIIDLHLVSRFTVELDAPASGNGNPAGTGSN